MSILTFIVEVLGSAVRQEKETQGITSVRGKEGVMSHLLADNMVSCVGNSEDSLVPQPSKSLLEPTDMFSEVASGG